MAVSDRLAKVHVKGSRMELHSTCISQRMSSILVKPPDYNFIVHGSLPESEQFDFS